MKKISNKIALAMVLLTFSVSLVLGISLYFQSKALIKAEAEKNLMTLLDREANVVEGEFLRVKRLSQVIKSVVESTFDLDLAQSNGDYMTTYKAELSPIFTRLLGDFGNVSDWILFNSDVIPGTHTVSYTYEEGQFIREAEYDVIQDGYASETWWRNAIDNGENWTAPYYWEPWHSDVISYSVPVIAKNTVIGVAGAELFLNAFQSRLENIKIYDSGYVMLISDRDEEVYVPQGVELSNIRTWLSENKTYIQEHPIGIQRLPSESGEEIIAWHMLENGWLLLARPITEEMFAGLTILNYITVVILLLSIPLSIGLGVWLSRTLTKRLSALTTVAEAMLDHHEVRPLEVSSKDEIGTLTRAFNQMQQNVKSTLSELKFNEEKYRSLVENSSNMIYTLDPLGCLITTNQVFESMVGMSKSELNGLHFTGLFKQEANAEYHQRAFDQLLETKSRIDFTVELDTPLGKKRTLTTALIPILDDHQQVVSVIGNSADITERIQTEKEIARLLSEENNQLNLIVAQRTSELERAMKEIMEADKIQALGILVSGIAHEINTPLGNAIALNSLVEKNLEVHSDKLSKNSLSRSSLETFFSTSEEAVSGISRNLDKTAALVNNFKYLSTTGSAELKTPVELKRLIQFTFNSMVTSLGLDQLQLNLICPENLSVDTYPGSLTQVLTNLLFNAAEHGLTDLNNSVISIEVSEQDNAVQLQISDNGQGMEPDVLKHIFEPFFTTKRSQGNSGLGLSIVFMKVTGILNGRITCESQLGKGTTFKISLPKF